MHSVANKKEAPVTGENGYFRKKFVVSAALWLRIQEFWGAMFRLVNDDRSCEGKILLWLLKPWRRRYYATSKHWKTLTRGPRETSQKTGIVNRCLCLFGDICLILCPTQWTRRWNEVMPWPHTQQATSVSKACIHYKEYISQWMSVTSAQTHRVTTQKTWIFSNITGDVRLRSLQLFAMSQQLRQNKASFSPEQWRRYVFNRLD